MLCQQSNLHLANVWLITILKSRGKNIVRLRTLACELHENNPIISISFIDWSLSKCTHHYIKWTLRYLSINKGNSCPWFVWCCCGQVNVLIKLDTQQKSSSSRYSELSFPCSDLLFSGHDTTRPMFETRRTHCFRLKLERKDKRAQTAIVGACGLSIGARVRSCRRTGVCLCVYILCTFV